MKAAILVIGLAILAAIVCVIGVNPDSDTAARVARAGMPGPDMAALAARVGAEWAEQKSPGTATVKVDNASSFNIVLTIVYANHAVEIAQGQLPAQQRQLLRAVLTEIKTQKLKLPSYIRVYTAAPFVGETGTHLINLGTSKWSYYSDLIQFEERGSRFLKL